MGLVEVFVEDETTELLRAVLYSPRTLTLGCDLVGRDLCHEQRANEVSRLAAATPLVGADTAYLEDLSCHGEDDPFEGLIVFDGSDITVAMRGAGGSVGRNLASQKGNQLPSESGVHCAPGLVEAVMTGRNTAHGTGEVPDGVA